MNDLYGFFDDLTRTKFCNPHYKCDKTDKDGIKYEIDIPGYDKDSVRISVESNKLKISGDLEGRDFVYSVPLSMSVYDLDKTKAEIKNGVLKLSIPYSEKSKPKSIEIS